MNKNNPTRVEGGYGGSSLLDNKSHFYNNPWSTNQSYKSYTLEVPKVDTDFSLYIYNLNTKQEIKLRLIPETISETYSPRIAKEAGIYGRVKPINIYTGGNAKTLSTTIELHEDLDNIQGSLYTLLEVLKSMSVPKSSTMIREPRVYLQLGTQFAGEGHIDTTYTFLKPFRRGRYIRANVSLTFTFHEEFGESYIDESLDSTEISSIGINLEDAYGRYMSELEASYYGEYTREEFNYSIEDFMKDLQVRDSYQLTQLYDNQKLLGGFLTNINYTSQALTDLINESLKYGTRIDEAGIHRFITSLGASDIMYIAIFNYYVDLSNILTSGLIVKNLMVNNLNSFKEDVGKYLSKFLEAASEGKRKSSSTSSYFMLDWHTGEAITMTAEKERLIKKELRNLISLADHQIRLFNSLEGAGS